MITRFASQIGRMAIACAILFTLAACGGGGGGGGGDFYSGDDEGEGTLHQELTLYGPDGEETNSVTAAAPGTLNVRVTRKNANGSAVGDQVVTVTTDIGLVVPESGTGLTNSNGVATFQIEAGDDKGAGTITSTTSDEGGSYSASIGFQVGESGLRLGYFDDDGDFIENAIAIEPGSTLASAGNAQLSVVILNADGERVLTTEEVRFNSGCIASGQATINPASPVLSSNGQVATTYTASGCSGTDNITASVVGASAQAFGSVSIASPQANGITFVSAEPSLIVLKGTGGSENRQETSDVVFKVVDSNGSPIQGIRVNFSLSTYVGGLTVTPASDVSDDLGQVKATVASGDVATVVRVIATVDGGNGETVSTVSNILTVTTGLPDQDSISLSVGGGGFVVENGFTQDGVTRTLTVSMADKFNNPVVDGTAAVFTTEYGAIVGSCTTTGGTCSVQWRSQEPRFPTLTGDDYVQTIGSSGATPNDLGYTRGGRSTILVHAIGEESFVDRNGNGIMDESEKDLFQNLPEAFIDHNEDGVYTPALASCQASPYGSAQCIAGIEEEFIDFNGNEEYDFNNDPAVYNGLLCPPEGDGVWCSRELVNVRDEITVILSADPLWDINLISTTAYIADIYNTRPPALSTVDVSVEGDCELLSESSFTVPNSSAVGAFGVPVVTISTEPSDPPEPGRVIVELKPIGGVTYSETYACSNSGSCDFSPKPPGCE